MKLLLNKAAKVVAIGPRGGKIVGYGAGRRPIYEGSQQAARLLLRQKRDRRSEKQEVAGGGREPNFERKKQQRDARAAGKKKADTRARSEGPTTETWEGKPSKPSPAYADTRATPGTVLHSLETGGFQIGTVSRTTPSGEKVTSDKIYIPAHAQNALVMELMPLARGTAERTRRRFHLGPQNNDDLRQAAFQGLAVAMASYQGGTSFLLRAQQYMKEYAALEARRLMDGFTLPRTMHRAYGKYLAAKFQAVVALREQKIDREPTHEEIAEKLRMRLADLYPDRVSPEQGKKTMPSSGWRLKDSAGKPIAGAAGQMPGKVEWVKRFASIQSGTEHVQGTDFLQDGQLSSVIPSKDPSPAEIAMDLGDKARYRKMLGEALGKIGEPHGTILKMRFGLHREDGEAASGDQIAKRISMRTKAGAKELSTRRKMDMLPKLAEEAKRKLAVVVRSDYRDLAEAMPAIAAKTAAQGKTLSQWLTEKKAAGGFTVPKDIEASLAEPKLTSPTAKKQSAKVDVTDPYTGKTKRLTAWTISDEGGGRPIMTGEVETGIAESQGAA